MTYVLGLIVLAYVSALVVAAVTGRVRVRSCCTVSDPADDLRMRAAFEDDATSADTLGLPPTEARSR